MNYVSPAPLDRAHRVRRRISRRFSITLVTLISLLFVGVSGYRLLEGMNFVDALYRTVTTITTVGFGEVQPLSSPVRLFTIGLIIGGVSIAAYALGSAAQFVVSGDMNLRPGADTLIEPGTRLIVLGTRDQLQELIAAAS